MGQKLQWMRNLGRRTPSLTDKQQASPSPLRRSIAADDEQVMDLQQQVLALKSNLQVAQNEKEALEKKLEALKEEMADSAKKEALRFHILLDMFGLQLLQTQPAKEVEDTLHSIAQH